MSPRVRWVTVQPPSTPASVGDPHDLRMAGAARGMAVDPAVALHAVKEDQVEEAVEVGYFEEGDFDSGDFHAGLRVKDWLVADGFADMAEGLARAGGVLLSPGSSLRDGAPCLTPTPAKEPLRPLPPDK